MGNNNNPTSNGRDYVSQVDIRGPPPGFNKQPEEDLGSATVRDALKNLGFGDFVGSRRLGIVSSFMSIGMRLDFGPSVALIDIV